ncbi:XrtA system polysaccharide chain length determinant [Rheinheimera tilapiae]|uniref:XrtA system polysaccharide chain length determinant n=1 Tax=Rheinheimera tilapiae TaxID=875043 RepID=A0ABV6BBI2_9GAMM
MKELNLALEMLLVYLQGIWLRRRYIILTAWLICPLGWLFVFNMPPTYQAEAKLFVETRSVLAPVLQGLTIRDNPQQEIELMARTLLSRPNLEKIAKATDMDIYASDSAAYEKLIDALKNDIKLGSSGRENIYVISYSNASPKMALKVVQETLNTFIENRVGDSVASSKKASEFLDTQITDYENRLVEAERRLSEFKKEQIALGPLSDSNFYGRIEGEKERLEEARLTLRELQSKLDSSRRQLRGEDPLALDQSGSSSSLTTQYDDRIKALQNQLDALLIRYTDQHPDVAETKRLLDSLQVMRKQEIEALQQAARGNPSASSGSQNEVYQNLKIITSNLENDVESAKVRVKSFEEKLETLERQRNVIPDIEAKFAGLNRDYELTKSKYEELLSRRDALSLSQKADESQQDVQFREIEPPRVPMKPSGPPRIVFYTLVLLVGVIGGLAMALVRSQLQPVVTSALQLKTISDFPVFGLVSHTAKDVLLRQSKKHLLYFLALSGVLMLCYTLLVTNELVFGITAKQILGWLI